MNTLGIIQARISSERLPGKVLEDVSGKPLLSHIIERLKRSKMIDQIVLATSTNPEDTVLKDISGEGARFTTRHSQRYYIGQVLDLVINMPGTKEVQARMKVTAVVLRIDSADRKNGEPDQIASIALKMETPLHFERLDLT